MNTSMTHLTKGRRLKEKAVEEFKLYWVVFAFLTLMFGAFTDYRRIVLREVGISYAHWGVAIIQAAIIAKVILIGQAMNYGKRIDKRPLIITVFVKAFLYGLLVAVFDVCERVIEALIHRDSWSAIVHRVVALGPYEMLANSLMIFVAFIPFFALWEVGRVIGFEKLAEMFLRGRPA